MDKANIQTVRRKYTEPVTEVIYVKMNSILCDSFTELVPEIPGTW